MKRNAKSGKGKARKRANPRIKALPPSDAAARDEGPRLIPLGQVRETTGLEHYLALADVALGQKKKI
jgi:hypothetical protein